MSMYRKRRMLVVLIVTFIIALVGVLQEMKAPPVPPSPPQVTQEGSVRAVDGLATLLIKGRAPRTGYTRSQFGNGWQESGSCNVREVILTRDLKQTEVRDCKVHRGILDDPYTGKTITFTRGPESSDDIQIDHVVALSDAWQKGAQQLSYEQREAFANDPLELLAVDGQANQNKSDGDAATWLPPNKSYRCRYVARQIAVKQKYSLWVTQAEYDAIKRILSTCPEQALPMTN